MRVPSTEQRWRRHVVIPEITSPWIRPQIQLPPKRIFERDQKSSHVYLACKSDLTYLDLVLVLVDIMQCAVEQFVSLALELVSCKSRG